MAFQLRGERRIVPWPTPSCRRSCSTPITHTVTNSVGISETDSDRYWASVGLKISAESGCGLAGGSVTVEMSFEFCYETTSSFTQFQDRTVSQEVIIAPHTTWCLSKSGAEKEEWQAPRSGDFSARFRARPLAGFHRAEIWRELLPIRPHCPQQCRIRHPSRTRPRNHASHPRTPRNIAK